jgi:hypothetical protein
MHRETTADELEAQVTMAPTSGDGEEAAEEVPPEGTETEVEVEHERVGVQTNQSQLSKSQKRRRHRR